MQLFPLVVVVRVASCLFPVSLRRVPQSLPKVSVVRARRSSRFVGPLGPSQFQDSPGLHTPQCTQVSFGVFHDLGHAPAVVWAFACRSSLFQAWSSLLSHRPRRFLHGRPACSRRIPFVSRQPGPVFQGMQSFPRVFVVPLRHRLLFA